MGPWELRPHEVCVLAGTEAVEALERLIGWTTGGGI